VVKSSRRAESEIGGSIEPAAGREAGEREMGSVQGPDRVCVKPHHLQVPRSGGSLAASLTLGSGIIHAEH